MPSRLQPNPHPHPLQPTPARHIPPTPPCYCCCCCCWWCCLALPNNHASSASQALPLTLPVLPTHTPPHRCSTRLRPSGALVIWSCQCAGSEYDSAPPLLLPLLPPPPPPAAAPTGAVAAAERAATADAALPDAPRTGAADWPATPRLLPQLPLLMPLLLPCSDAAQPPTRPLRPLPPPLLLLPPLLPPLPQVLLLLLLLLLLGPGPASAQLHRGVTAAAPGRRVPSSGRRPTASPQVPVVAAPLPDTAAAAAAAAAAGAGEGTAATACRRLGSAGGSSTAAGAAASCQHRWKKARMTAMKRAGRAGQRAM